MAPFCSPSLTNSSSCYWLINLSPKYLLNLTNFFHFYHHYHTPSSHCFLPFLFLLLQVNLLRCNFNWARSSPCLKSSDVSHCTAIWGMPLAYLTGLVSNCTLSSTLFTNPFCLPSPPNIDIASHATGTWLFPLFKILSPHTPPPSIAYFSLKPELKMSLPQGCLPGSSFKTLSPFYQLSKYQVPLLGTVRRVYAPRFFVSSQQRFGVTDIKAPWRVTALRGQTVL